jgi:hypothetical protein
VGHVYQPFEYFRRFDCAKTPANALNGAKNQGLAQARSGVRHDE